MPVSVNPSLRPGTVYRTRSLRKYGENPTRLAARLVNEGRLEKLRSGLYYAPRKSRFGAVPPSDQELLRAFFGGAPYLVTGPSVWNTLALGSTAVANVQLVYNAVRTGELELAGRRFYLRRVRFPRRDVGAEYFVIDLFENAELAGVELSVLGDNLSRALANQRFDPSLLEEAARRYGSKRTLETVRQAMAVRQSPVD